MSKYRREKIKNNVVSMATSSIENNFFMVIPKST